MIWFQSREVVENAVNAMGSTGSALLGKQMEGEPPVDVSSDKLEMKVRGTLFGADGCFNQWRFLFDQSDKSVDKEFVYDMLSIGSIPAAHQTLGSVKAILPASWF